MAKLRGYTVDVQTGPLLADVDAILELLPASLELERRLAGPVVSGNTLSRTISVRTSVDALSAEDALVTVVYRIRRATKRIGLDAEALDFIDVAVMAELAEDDFASARDDIVGTPDVAERLGISRQRVAQLLAQKGRFPTPIASVRGTQVWRWGDIADWIAAGARDMRRRKPTSEELEELRRRTEAGVRESKVALRLEAARRGRGRVATKKSA